MIESIMTAQEIQERLLLIAKAEAAHEELLEDLRTHLDGLRAMFGIADLERAIQHLEENPDILRSELKELFSDHVAAGGATDIHPLIEFRHVERWQYDETDALAWCEQNAPECIKPSLKKREFGKVLDEGKYPDAEKVASPVIAIKDVSHLLIG
jgi:hypothetical protein